MRDSDINSNYAHGILRSAKEQKEELCRHAQLDDDGRHIIEQHKFDALMKELFEQLESFLDDNAVGIELTPEEKIYVLERVLTFKNISIEKFSDKAGVNSNSYRSLDEFIQHNFVTITLDNVFIEKFYTGHYPYGYFSYIVKNSKILDHLFHGYKNDCHFLADNCDIDTLELARIKSPLGNSTFQNKTKIRYIEANDLSIKGFRLHDCELGHSDGILNLNFDDATFMAPTLFKNCVFYSSPSFHNTKFYSDTVFKDCVFKDRKSDWSENRYRALKEALEAIGATHQAQFFHGLELEARRNNSLPRLRHVFHSEWVASFCSHFLKRFNDYGRNYWLPWLWLFSLIVLGMLAYLISHGLGCNPEKYTSSELWQKTLCDGNGSVRLTNEVLASAIYSLQHSLGPIGLIIDNGLISAKMLSIKTFSVLQMMLSSVFWYLIIVQIRSQFKL